MASACASVIIAAEDGHSTGLPIKEGETRRFFLDGLVWALLRSADDGRTRRWNLGRPT
jgi:hypothetical protein